MKNVPIKFRGEDIISGEYHYGDYVTRSEGCAIRVRENDKLFDLHEYEIAVKPESVAQLVGYDANGDEVYEGDKIFDVEYPADTVTAELFPCVLFRYYKLIKENDND
ncbi:MAG: hypothetical protein IKZ58_06400 [Selenomonadaceae bacterium]|nr:hypothetical protein [Selenomonadaceae bacterium]